MNLSQEELEDWLSQPQTLEFLEALKARERSQKMMLISAPNWESFKEQRGAALECRAIIDLINGVAKEEDKDDSLIGRG